MSTALATRSSAPLVHVDAPSSKVRTQSSVHDQRWVILAVLCLSLFISVLDDTIMNVTLPSLVRQLGATTSQLKWIVDAFAVVFAGLLLAAGSLADRFGRKPIMVLLDAQPTCGSPPMSRRGASSPFGVRQDLR